MANVGFGLSLRGAKKEEVRRSVEQALAMVGLAPITCCAGASDFIWEAQTRRPGP
jgi:ABC-type taurine transport system ATPase subunit